MMLIPIISTVHFQVYRYIQFGQFKFPLLMKFTLLVSVDSPEAYFYSPARDLLAKTDKASLGLICNNVCAQYPLCGLK